MVDPNAKSAPAPAAAPGGVIDTDAMLNKIAVPPELQDIYQKALLSGMRIMFDSKSHAMMQNELNKKGPLPQKIVEGVMALIYMLWKQSNQTLPPKIILPLTMALTLKVFEYLQRSNEPGVTNEVLGQTLEGVIPAVMKKFGVKPGQAQGAVQQAAPAAASPSQAPPPQAGGLLTQGG